MKDAGTITLNHGGAGVALGGWDGVNIRHTPFDLRICPKCGRVEFYV